MIILSLFPGIEAHQLLYIFLHCNTRYPDNIPYSTLTTLYPFLECLARSHESFE